MRRFIQTASSDLKSNFASLLPSSIVSIQSTSSHLIKTIKLTKPKSLEYHPGQAIDVFVPSLEGEVHSSKATFSLISAPIPTNEDTIEIAVKSTQYYPIQWMMEKAQIGDTLWIGAKPIGQMFEPILCAPTEPLTMIGAGIGITPILSIVQYLDYISKTSDIARNIEIIHQARSVKEFLCWPRLVAFAEKHPNVHLSYFVSDDRMIPSFGDHEEALRPCTKSGAFADSHLDALHLTSAHNVILCGPAGFVNATRQSILRRYDIPSHRIHSDPQFQR
jgi:ferredoxin-NADP reductase